METLLHIIAYTIPGIIVFITAFYSIKLFMKNDQDKRNAEIREKTVSVSIPIKLQAYERLVLFLERVNPESLLIRTQSAEMSAGQLHHDILVTIRAEFEHNLSQQIYISSQSWLAVKRAKEVLIKIINEEAAKIAVNAPASALSEGILIRIIQMKDNPIQIAIDTLKSEVSTFL